MPNVYSSRMHWEFPKFWIKDNRLKMFILLPRNNHILFWIMIISNCDIMIFSAAFKCIMPEKTSVPDASCQRQIMLQMLLTHYAKTENVVHAWCISNRDVADASLQWLVMSLDHSSCWWQIKVLLHHAKIENVVHAWCQKQITLLMHHANDRKCR